nr:transglutaminase domain-containing protein [Myxococcaceae bacterium]
REWSAPSTAEPAASRVLMPIARQPGLKFNVTQEIELTAAYDSRTLVALDTPALFARATTIGLKGVLPTTLVHVPGDQVYASLDGVQVAYTATSVDVRGSDRAEPTAQTLEVPALDPRVRSLTTELVGTATSNLEKATRLERELTRRYGYTLELPGDVDDPLADFLFVRKAGHCEDFATALAVMLRLEGIPSRVTTGFVGGQRVGNRYHVRAGDAHAWTEAFIDGAWRRFDATPEDGRSASPPRWLAALTEQYEALEEWWRKRVLDYSFQDQFQFVRGLVRPPRGAVRDEAAEVRDEPLTPPRWAPGAAGVAGAIAVAVALTRRRRAHRASSFLAAIEARLTAAGVDPREAPLEELAQRLALRGHELSAPLARATRRYLEARFGDRPMGADERRELLAGLERRPAPRPG